MTDHALKGDNHPLPQPLKLLIVEDNAHDADLMVRELRRSGFEPRWTRVDTEADYLNGLHSGLDIILSDYDLPRFSGLRALDLLKARGLEVPFIVVSGTIGEETAVAAMKEGATDFLLKDRMVRLGPAVRRAVKEVEERRERRTLQQQFIEAQKMEVLGHLAGGVAHDFNNLLSIIMCNADLMMYGLKPGDPSSNYVEEIQHASMRAKGLTEQLLIFSRKQTVQFEVLDLNEVMESMGKILRRLVNENIELNVLPGKQLGRISADAGQIGQVLMNLVVNARDAMPAAGRLTVATDNVTWDEDHVRLHPGAVPGDYVMLAVSDTGTGMTDEVKRRLFEAFFTTKPKGKGTGLGLATCRAIVSQCGGQIGIESTVGQGTVFRIYFPRVAPPLAVSAVPPSFQANSLARGTETLLLVEDEPSVRHLACGVLEQQGYHVLRANNGQDGLRVAREFKGRPIDLVITDVIMPQMGGKVMSDWLKAIHPELKVLFTSGYTADAIAPDGVLEPGVAFLPKPYTPAILTRKVRSLLDEKIAPEAQPS